MNSPIFKEYCSHLTEYKQKYGEKTTVLMQVGSFYEIYAILTDTHQLGETSIYHLCQTIMNIAVTAKNVGSISEHLMAGFQLPYSGKFIRLLIDQGYTVVLVDQVSEAPKPVREVTKIVSPGTYTEPYNKEDNNYMMSLYIEAIDGWNAVGLSVIDVSTGDNFVYQVGHSPDSQFWKDEINRLLSYYSPKELLIHLHKINLTKEEMLQYWDIDALNLQVNHYTNPCFQTVSYQSEVLQKVFSTNNPMEELSMIYKPELCKAYVYMLQYIYDHKVDCLRNIQKPKTIETNHYLSLTSNSARQLTVVGNYSYYKGKCDSLYTLCSGCGFTGGRRLLKHRLLYPSVDSDILNLRYNKIGYFQTNKKYEFVKSNIRKLIDLDKVLRKMGLGDLRPDELSNWKLSYDFINRIVNVLDIQTDLEFQRHYTEYTDDITEYHRYYQTLIDLYDFDHFYEENHSYFKPGHYPQLDIIQKDITQSVSMLHSICDRFSGVLDVKQGCKLGYNDKLGYYIYCTKHRSKTLKSRFDNNLPNHIVNIRDASGDVSLELSIHDISFVKKDTNNVFIENPQIKQLLQSVETQTQLLKTENQTYWKQSLSRLYDKHHSMLERIHKMIADIDVSSTLAKLALDNKYCRPELIDSSKSCLRATDIRHPLIEQISDTTEYVTNNVTLGVDGCDGMLLYGTNACGKSTLMKAVGLSVIMAQAGFYVPCSRFQLKPYTQLFTRILNNDNIFRAQSSFAVEMTELKSIFQLSDENSLILGDELCSGTETLSAISIVCQSLSYLSSKKCSFMITSHLHQLTSLPKVTNLSNLHIYHLQIRRENSVLIYDRKLVPGPGPPIYGLQVCEAMGLPEEFIKESNRILKQLSNQDAFVVSTKQSSYNKDVFMDCCGVCKEPSKETHHIKEQYLADNHNMIDHHHKNKKHNLVPLCKSCHQKVTYGSMIIRGWVNTSEGVYLDYELIKPQKASLPIETYVKPYLDLLLKGKMTKKTCLDMIDSKHNLRISSKQLTQYLDTCVNID